MPKKRGKLLAFPRRSPALVTGSSTMVHNRKTLEPVMLPLFIKTLNCQIIPHSIHCAQWELDETRERNTVNTLQRPIHSHICLRCLIEKTGAAKIYSPQGFTASTSNIHRTSKWNPEGYC